MIKYNFDFLGLIFLVYNSTLFNYSENIKSLKVKK